MNDTQVISRLQGLGFSEYESRAYVALLQKNPVTGYELSKLSGVPRSMIYEVLGKLTARGAALSLPAKGTTLYAPVSYSELLDRMQREHQDLIRRTREDLASLSTGSELDVVWNIKGADNIVAKAQEMIRQAQTSLHLALLPATFALLEPALGESVTSGVQVVLYATGEVALPGAEVVIPTISQEAMDQAGALALILVMDSQEVLISEGLMGSSGQLLVFIAEHHLRTDLYLPRLLAMIGDAALDLIRPDDRELFAQVLESSLPPSAG